MPYQKSRNSIDVLATYIRNTARLSVLRIYKAAYIPIIPIYINYCREHARDNIIIIYNSSLIQNSVFPLLNLYPNLKKFS